MDPTAVGTSSNHLIAIGIACVVGFNQHRVGQTHRRRCLRLYRCRRHRYCCRRRSWRRHLHRRLRHRQHRADQIYRRRRCFACVAIVSAVGTGVVLTGSAVGTRTVGTVVLVNPAIHVSIDVASCHYCCRPRYQLRTQSSTSAQCLIVGLGRRRHRCQLCMWSSTSA